MSKLLTIEAAVRLSDRLVEVAGRCCREPICIGDNLSLSDDDGMQFRVARIEVYHRSVECLEHGYVGTLCLESIDGREPPIGGTLVDAHFGETSPHAE